MYPYLMYVDDRIVTTHVFTLDEYAFTSISAWYRWFFIKNGITLHDDLIPFDRYNLTGIFIHESSTHVRSTRAAKRLPRYLRVERHGEVGWLTSTGPRWATP